MSAPKHALQVIAQASSGDLRRALMCLQIVAQNDPNFDAIPDPYNPLKTEHIDALPRPDWDKYIVKVAGKIIGEQTPERLLDVRAMLYELLAKQVGPTLILSVRLASPSALSVSCTLIDRFSRARLRRP